MLKTGCQYCVERPLHSLGKGFLMAGDVLGRLVRTVSLGSALHGKQLLVNRRAK